MLMKTTLVLLALAAAFGFGGRVATTSADSSTVDIKLVSLAAWTGEVDSMSTDGGDAGGAPTLAAYWQNERATNPILESAPLLEKPFLPPQLLAAVRAALDAARR